MKTLIIHHLEPTWEEGYIEYGLKTFEQLCIEVAEHIAENNYGRIILTQFEWLNLDNREEYIHIRDLVNFQHEYSYGWSFESHFYALDRDEKTEIRDRINAGGIVEDDYGMKFVVGGNHSEIVHVADWMEELPKKDVYICGAFDGECIEDLEIALRALDINFNRVEELIIGT